MGLSRPTDDFRAPAARTSRSAAELNVAQQFLTAGLVDEMELHVVPILLGAGERLFDNIDTSRLQLEQVRTIEGHGVPHIAYRSVARQSS